MRTLSRRTLLTSCSGALGLAACAWLGCRELKIDRPIEPALAPRPAGEPPTAKTSDPRGWPCLFGPELTSVSAETGLATDWDAAGPPELWRIAVGTGYSSPVVVADDLIVLHRLADREVVSCFSAATGQPKWEHSWPTSFQCQYPPYSSGPYGTPLIAGDLVFAAGAQGRLVALARADGAVVWERDLARDLRLKEGLFAFGPGLTADDNRLYLNAGGAESNSGVIALDKLTGDTLWSATDHAMAYTTPRLVTLHGRRLLLVLTETGLACLDPDSGREHWTFPFHSQSIDTINAVTPAVQDDLVLLVAGPGPGAVCLRIEPDLAYSEVWSDRRLLDSQFNSLVHWNGHLFGFTAKRQGGSIFKCLEFATGELCWEFPSDLGRGQALAAGGKILILGESGALAALDLSPDEPTLRAPITRPLLVAPAYSAPALSGGKLFLRDEAHLLCLGMS